MNKNQNWRRVLSLLFAMVMLVSMMVVGSVVASAQEAEPVQEDHYVVALKIDGVTTNYTSFDEAWDAMNATGNVQVDFYILADIELTKSYVLEKEKHINYLMSNPASKFTLNGTTDEPLFVINKGRMTVKNINIVSKGDTFQVGGGTLSIQAVGGTSTQRTNVTSLEGSVLNITGGTVDFTGGPVLTALGTQPAVKNDGKGTLSVKQWSWNNESILQAPNAETVITWNGEGALNISFGFIDGEIAANDASKVNISGGTFTADMTKYCDPAYCTVKDADGKYVLAPKVLTVNGVAYADWADALTAMTASNVEIKFYTDIDSGDLATLGADRGSLTIDLNGYNWTMRRLSFNSRMTNVTIVNTAERESLIQTVGGDNRLNIGYNTPVDIQSNIAFDGTVQLFTPNGAAGSFKINGVSVLGAKNSGSILESNNTNGSIRITFKNNNLDITLHHGDLLLAKDFTTLVSQNIVLNTHINVVEGVTLTIDPTTNLTIGSSGSIDGEGTIAVGSLAHLNLVFDKTAIKNVHFTNSFALDGVVLSDEDMNYTGAANLLNSGVGITAGTFDADVKALCPAGYCVPEENGVWTVLSAHNYDAGVETAPTYEADGFTTYTCENCGDSYVVVDEGSMLVLATVEMNGVKYPTIYDALNVLQPRETATIKFLEDYTFTADQRMFSNYTIVINAEYVTLDLNGKTITFDYTGSTATCYASIAIYNKGTLTIMDSSEEKTGTLYSKTAIQGKDGPRILWITSAGVATIEGGNFISEQGDTMFYTSNSNAELPTCLYIKGGYFEHTIPTNGSEYRYFNQQNGYQKQIIEISGGTFKHNPTDGEMQYEEGFGFAENPDGTFGVRPHVYDAGVYTAPTLEADGFTTYTCVDCGVTNVVTHAGTMLVPVAEVNGVVYASLQEAINACKNGETVKVLVDLVFGADDVVYAHGGATGFGDYDQYNPTIFYVGGTKGVNGAANQPSDVNVVIDLNGHSLTNTVDTYFFMFMDNCKVTFKDSVGGGMLYAKAEAPVIWVVGTETLVTIESGYYLTDSATGVLHCTHGGDLVIEGGEFETTADDASLLLMLNTKDRQNSKFFIKGVATITIKGGNFHGFNPAKVGDDNGATSIAGIKFVDGCAEGFCPVLNADGTYGVAEELIFKGARLLLKDGIGIYFMLNTADLVETNYVAVFTFGGKTVEVPFANWKHFADGFNTGILFDGVDAKSIATEVSVVIYSNGMAVSETQTMSVKGYAEAILAGDYADDAKELAKALLNYGALAENAILGANNDVNADVNSKFEDLDVEMSAGSVTTEEYYGSSVNLNTYLGFNFKFFANAVEGATHAEITYNGKTVVVDASVFTTETKKGNVLVVIELEQLLASDAAFELTCTVYNGKTELATATDSVYNYCARALAGLAKMDGTAYEAQKYKSEFYKALVLYVEAAKGYTEAIAE